MSEPAGWSRERSVLCNGWQGSQECECDCDSAKLQYQAGWLIKNRCHPLPYDAMDVNVYRCSSRLHHEGSGYEVPDSKLNAAELAFGTNPAVGRQADNKHEVQSLRLHQNHQVLVSPAQLSARHLNAEFLIYSTVPRACSAAADICGSSVTDLGGSEKSRTKREARKRTDLSSGSTTRPSKSDLSPVLCEWIPAI